MRKLFVIVLVTAAVPALAWENLFTAQEESTVCGTVIKVGDIQEQRNVVTLLTKTGSKPKIYVEGASLSITTELTRATQAMVNDLKYCAQYQRSGDKIYLLQSSVERK